VPFDYDAFLSYNRAEAPEVEYVARALERAELHVFLDRWRLTPGLPWQDEIERALDRSAACVVFIGPHGPSPWSHSEMRAALELRAKHRVLRIIPVLLPGVDARVLDALSVFLKEFTWVDLRGGTDDAVGLSQLKAAIAGDPLSVADATARDLRPARALRNAVIHPLPPAVDFQDRPELTALKSLWSRDAGSGVVALIGIGGSGKTALVSHFLQQLRGSGVESRDAPKDDSLPAPDGVFVWSFYDNPNVEFFAGALYEFLTGEEVGRDPARDLTYRLIQTLGRSNLRRVLIVLDGVEIIQESRGSEGGFGLIRDTSVRHLVRRIAQGAAGLTMLLTTRFPFPDLAVFAGMGYRQIETDILDLDSARALLRSRGVRGSAAEIDGLIGTFGRHALTLDHLGTLLHDFFGGAPGQAGALPTLEHAKGDAYAEYQAARLGRIFAFYEQNLPSAELEILRALSVFRLPVEIEIVTSILSGKDTSAGESPRKQRAAVSVRAALAQLRSRRLISFQARDEVTLCSVHPAVRDHFYRALGASSSEIHASVHTHLVSLFERPGRRGKPTDQTTLDLAEELVYHTAQSGDLQPAVGRYTMLLGYDHIGWQLADYQRGLRVTSCLVDRGGIELREKYKGDSPALERSLFLLDLGQLHDAEALMRSLLTMIGESPPRSSDDETAFDEGFPRLRDFCALYELSLLQSLADLSLMRGELVEAEALADTVIATVDNAFERPRERRDDMGFVLLRRAGSGWNPMGRRAAARALLGKTAAAISDFEGASTWQAEWRTFVGRAPTWGIHTALHAALLVRQAKPDAALAILSTLSPVSLTWAPLVAAHHALVQSDISLLNRDRMTAAGAVDRALAWAMQSGHQETYARAQLARARISWRGGDAAVASIAISEAIETARRCGFRICQIDSLVAAGHMSLALGDLAEVRNHSDEACETAHRCGYQWGIGDAVHLKAELAMRSGDTAAARRSADDAISIRTSIGDPKVDNTKRLRAMLTGA
jgi:hypothetical protein